MKRYHNEIFTKNAIYHSQASYALNLKSDPNTNSVKAQIIGTLKPTNKEGIFDMTIYQQNDHNQFDAESIVDINAETLFQENIKESKIDHSMRMAMMTPNDAAIFSKACGLNVDDYNSLEISSDDLSEIIDLLKDGTYLIRLCEY